MAGPRKKFCINCIHYRDAIFLDSHDEYDPNDFPSFSETYRQHVCMAPEAQVPNRVTGLCRVISAGSERADGAKCGPSGKLFEAKTD